jgi:multidrug transporter EmrE-like cation transporter
MKLIEFSLILAGVLLNAVAQLCLKAGTRGVGIFAYSLENILPIGWRLASNPYIVSGLLCYVASVIVWIMALSRVEVSIAYPLLSIGYIVNMLLAWRLLGEEINAMRIAGVFVIIVGVIMVARS